MQCMVTRTDSGIFLDQPICVDLPDPFLFLYIMSLFGRCWKFVTITCRCIS